MSYWLLPLLWPATWLLCILKLLIKTHKNLGKERFWSCWLREWVACSKSHTPSKWQGRDFGPTVSSPKLFLLHLKAKHCLQHLLKQLEMISHQQSQIWSSITLQKRESLKRMWIWLCLVLPKLASHSHISWN